MGVARVLVAALAMVTTVRADNCKKMDEAYMLEPTLPQYCNGGDADTCTKDSCPCMNCCKVNPATCRGKRASESCDAGKEYDDTKRGATVDASNTYKATCCMTKTTTTTAPLGNVCSNEAIAQKALAGGNFCNLATEAADITKALTAVKADGTDYKGICCIAKGKCSSVTCKAGRKLISTAATKLCLIGTCKESECCENDTTKCAGVAGTCGTDKFRDTTKAGTAATSTDFVAKCCSAKATCDAFQKSTSIGTTSTSTKQHGVTLSFVLAGVAAMGKSL